MGTRTHPPFCAHGDAPFAAPTTDYLTQSGAGALAARIRMAWAKAGHIVETRVEHVVTSRGVGLYVVRMPGLMNGLPAKQVPA